MRPRMGYRTIETHPGAKERLPILIKKLNIRNMTRFIHRFVNIGTLDGVKKAERLQAQGWLIIATGFDTVMFEKAV